MSIELHSRSANDPLRKGSKSSVDGASEDGSSRFGDGDTDGGLSSARDGIQHCCN